MKTSSVLLTTVVFIAGALNSFGQPTITTATAHEDDENAASRGQIETNHAVDCSVV